MSTDNLLPENERLSELSKINLLCAQITHMAINVHTVREYYKQALWDIKKGTFTPAHPKMHQESKDVMDAILGETVKSLSDAYENLADFINGRDMLCETDVALSEPVWNAVNDIAPDDYEEDFPAIQ